MEVSKLGDLSITQVMSRSINTSITTGVYVLTILVVAVLFKIDSIYEFSLPMLLGLISGCYSSICIASILWVMFEKLKLRRKCK